MTIFCVLKGLKIAHLLLLPLQSREGILTVGIARNRTPRALVARRADPHKSNEWDSRLAIQAGRLIIVLLLANSSILIILK